MVNQEKENWKVNCELRIDMKNQEDAEIFLNSFSPEIDTIPMKRASMNIRKENQNIFFQIKALDLTAFRASMNSLLQFGNVVDTIIDYVDNGQYKLDQKDDDE
jgi:tRNA threonylcarbamoyladenosine modification (KEOPS) complex  Pcc1 subunit